MSVDASSLPTRPRWRIVLGVVAVALVALLATDFIGHAWDLGWQGLRGVMEEENRLFRPDAPVATAAIFVHMVAGAVLTALAPVQLLGPVRRRWPALHRWSGRTLVVSGLATGVTGLAYIGLQGTVGGPDMSAAFALYGALVLLASVQAIRFARARAFARHRRWGLRLAVLGLGSWIYRMHYGLWFITTGGLAVNTDDFSGLFDRITVWAFFVPYLVALELMFWAERRPRQAVPAGSD